MHPDGLMVGVSGIRGRVGEALTLPGEIMVVEQGRPAPQAARPMAAATPNYESDLPSIPEDAAPQVKEEDIPF